MSLLKHTLGDPEEQAKASASARGEAEQKARERRARDVKTKEADMMKLREAATKAKQAEIKASASAAHEAERKASVTSTRPNEWKPLASRTRETERKASASEPEKRMTHSEPEKKMPPPGPEMRIPRPEPEMKMPYPETQKRGPVSEPEKKTSTPASAGQRQMESEQRDKNLKKEQQIQLEGEKLHAAKHQHKVGEVVLKKEVVKDQQSLDVPVTHEEVFVERHSFSERPSGNERPLGEGEALHIPISAEEVSVTKDRVVIGDVVVEKREVQETKHFTETCQHEEAHLEKEGEVPFWDQKSGQEPTQQGMTK